MCVLGAQQRRTCVFVTQQGKGHRGSVQGWDSLSCGVGSQGLFSWKVPSEGTLEMSLEDGWRDLSSPKAVVGCRQVPRGWAAQAGTCW